LGRQAGKEEAEHRGRRRRVTSLALSKDGKHAHRPAQGSWQSPNGLFVNRRHRQARPRRARLPNKIDAITLSHDGALLPPRTPNGNTRLWQYPSFIDNVNQPAYWTQQDPNGAPITSAFSPDDKTLVRCSPFSIKLYATPLPGAPFQVGAPRATVSDQPASAVPLTAGRQTLYTGGFEATSPSGTPTTSPRRRRIQGPHNLHVTAHLQPRGNRLASCSGDFIVRL